jgi:hypothetical protein
MVVVAEGVEVAEVAEWLSRGIGLELFDFEPVA